MKTILSAFFRVTLYLVLAPLLCRLPYGPPL